MILLNKRRNSIADQHIEMTFIILIDCIKIQLIF
jgi:hypothetical protein